MKSILIDNYFKTNSTKFKNTIKYLKEKGYNSEQILRIMELNVYVELNVKINRGVWLERVLQLIKK